MSEEFEQEIENEATAEVALETSQEAVILAQETLTELAEIRREQKNEWQQTIMEQVTQAVSLAQQILAKMEASQQPVNEVAPAELTIEETTPQPIKNGKKTRKKKLRL